MAKKCKWISGLPNKVKHLWLLLVDGCVYSVIIHNLSSSHHMFVVSQNSRHRCAAWLLTCLNKQVSNVIFFFLFIYILAFSVSALPPVTVLHIRPVSC